MNDQQINFGDWLYSKYLEWLGKQPDKPARAMGKFCEYLNISQSMFSQYVHDHRKPTRRAVHAIASQLGSEVYTVLGITPPSSELEELSKQWDDLSQETRIKIMALAKANKKR